MIVWEMGAFKRAGRSKLGKATVVIGGRGLWVGVPVIFPPELASKSCCITCKGRNG